MKNVNPKKDSLSISVPMTEEFIKKFTEFSTMCEASPERVASAYLSAGVRSLNVIDKKLGSNTRLTKSEKYILKEFEEDINSDRKIYD